MPRYRKLHVKTVESFDFNDMPDDFHRVFWLTLPLQLSSEGTLPADAMLIRSKVFPLRRDVTCDKIEAALAWFANRDMIRFYEVDGHRYLWAVNFAKYQGVTTKEAASDYPPVPEQVKTNARVSQELVEQESSTDAVFNMQYAVVSSDDAPIVESSDDVEPVSESDGNHDNHHSIQSFDSDRFLTSEQNAEVIQAWCSGHPGLPNDTQTSKLDDWAKECHNKQGHAGAEWVCAALREAALGNRDPRGPTLGYVRSIIDRWLVDGFEVKGSNKGDVCTGKGLARLEARLSHN